MKHLDWNGFTLPASFQVLISFAPESYRCLFDVCWESERMIDGDDLAAFHQGAGQRFGRFSVYFTWDQKINSPLWSFNHVRIDRASPSSVEQKKTCQTKTLLINWYQNLLLKDTQFSKLNKSIAIYVINTITFFILYLEEIIIILYIAM